MAWNEPGGKGDKDPWGSRGSNNKGAVTNDLDELMKKIQTKLGGVFGGSGSGRGGASPDNVNKLLSLIAVVIVVAWAFSGLYTVEEGKQAVVLQFGAYKETTGPGLHWYPRMVQTVETVDVSRIQKSDIGSHTGARTSASAGDHGTLMLTQDENIVDLEMSVQYKVKSAKDYLFNVADPDVTLRQAMESALREIIGKSKMDFVITEGRGEIGQRAETMVQQILDRYQTGLVVTSVNLQGARAPEQVRSAFEDAVKAREDEQRLKNEAEAYSNDIIPKARGAAARQLEDANAYKSRVVAHAEGEAVRFSKVLAEYQKEPAVTRERLYLEMVESVLGSTSKVMVDMPGNNNMVYLPLDKFLENQRGAANGSGSSSAAAAFPDSVPPASAPQDTAATRSAVGEQRDRLRSREGR
ncbi:MAG: FtsH protease activity modulator HflK [Gammaproteobacteria bacterium]|nr:FtsH protease activity modulator HflK [Gammaproteobacteria bacterium]